MRWYDNDPRKEFFEGVLKHVANWVCKDIERVGFTSVKLLDVGADEGQFIDMLPCRDKIEAYAVEINESKAGKLIEKYEGVYVGDAGKIKYKNLYEYIVVLNVVYAYEKENVIRLLGWLSRYLNYGGKIIVTYDSDDSPIVKHLNRLGVRTAHSFNDEFFKFLFNRWFGNYRIWWIKGIPPFTYRKGEWLYGLKKWLYWLWLVLKYGFGFLEKVAVGEFR